jgi:anti-sigma factor RsiW
MSCNRYERWAGLYVGGDLDGAAVRKLEEHLESCADCRELLEGLRQTRVAIEGSRDEPLGDSVLRDFRQGVMERVEADSTRAPFWLDGFGKAGWRWVLAGSLALVLAAVWLALFTLRTVDSPERTAERVAPTPTTAPPSRTTTSIPDLQPPVVKQEPPVAVLHEPEPAIVEPASQKPVEVEPAAEDLVVKLVTDNPDIVIYWLVERNGG